MSYQERKDKRLFNLYKSVQEQEAAHQRYLLALDEQKVLDQRKRGQVGWKIVKQGWDGIVNIARSLNTPNTTHRPKISQLPGRRSDMDIVRDADLRLLVTPSLRGRDIRGRKIDAKDFYRRRKELR